MELGESKKRILDYLTKAAKAHKFPSIREISNAIGLKSTATTFHHLEELHHEGLIEWEKGQSRSIRIKRYKEETCPCCGGTGWKNFNGNS